MTIVLYIHRCYLTRKFQELTFLEEKRNGRFRCDVQSIFLFAEEEMDKRA